MWKTSGIPSILLAGEGTPLARRGEGEVDIAPRGRFGLAKAVRRVITVNAPSSTQTPVVLSHFTHDLGPLRWALRGTPNVRLIVIKHVSPGSPKYDPLHRWIYKRVDRLLGVSEFVAEKCRTAYPIPGERIGVWHPGVDPDRFAFNESARRDIRAHQAATDDQVVFGYVGRITPNKGIEWLLDAFLGLTADVENARLWIVGGSSADERSYEDNMRQSVAAHKCGDRVTFTGYQDAVHEYMSALDVFVTPSCEESFGLTTVEAMLAARPVIGFNIAGTGEIVADGQTGILVDPQTDRVNGLREAFVRMLNDCNSTQQMGQQGRSRALKTFSHQAMIDRLEPHVRND
ncbi:MAG: glycosyltransferase [candidate division Zixibacteria bacterium]|nr:glycosyltransferase [candidate division Zixibacteria bacterium]